MLTVLNSSHDPFYNQAFEEYVFEHFREGEIFLLWQNDPAVIVGSYQNICREVHVERLRQLGIPVIRRITGGGTVYHDLGNLNYTYISDGGAAIDYDQCLGPILAALNDIGVPARKNRTCDIAIGGGKISGSAQRMTKGRLLHHGTLLFSSDLGVLDRITTHRKNDCFQSKGTQSAICPVTNIREHLARPMTIEEFRERLLDRMVPPGSPRLTLTPEQEAEVFRLRDDIFIACTDNLTGFSAAIEAVFPKTEIQNCIIHQLRNSSKYVSYKDIKALMADLKAVYAAVDESAALDALDAFAEKWDKKYPKIAQSWRENWANLSTYFKYPQEVRRLIYTTNAIEGFNRQLRKVTKAKSVFPTDDSLLKMLYLAMTDITKKWTGRRQDWSMVHAQLAVFFADRMPN